MKTNLSLLVATTVLAGLMAAPLTYADDQAKESDQHKSKDSCKTKNSCKGKEAKAKDSCKGKEAKAKDACNGKNGCGETEKAQ